MILRVLEDMLALLWQKAERLPNQTTLYPITFQTAPAKLSCLYSLSNFLKKLGLARFLMLNTSDLSPPELIFCGKATIIFCVLFRELQISRKSI